MAKTIAFRHEGASVDLSIWGDGTATVNRLYSKFRGLGHANYLMQAITDYADGVGLTLILIAWPFKAERNCMDADQLVQFYSKFGFVPDEKVPLVGTYMIRQPTVKMAVENP